MDHECRVPECTKDSDCAFDETCEKHEGSDYRTCEPILLGDCGMIEDHQFVPYEYECGAEPGCPSCPQNERCEEHLCVGNNLTGPPGVIVGNNATVNATENGRPCALCDLVITQPDGRNITGRTNESGSFVLPLTEKGNYLVTLVRGGVPVRSITVQSLPLAVISEPEKPSATPKPDEYSLLWLLLLLLLAIAAIAYWRRRKKERLQKGGAKPAAAARPQAKPEAAPPAKPSAKPTAKPQAASLAAPPATKPSEKK
jgi:hypothetical protein